MRSNEGAVIDRVERGEEAEQSQPSTSWLTSRPPDVVEGGGRILRRWRLTDADPIRGLVAANLDHLSPWMPWARDTAMGTDRGFVERAIERFELGTDFAYVVLDVQDQAVIGACALHARIGPGALEVGYWISSSHARQGHGTGAALALTGLAFDLPEVG